jgi:hypothetical protein
MTSLRLVEDLQKMGEKQPSNMVFFAPPTGAHSYAPSEMARDGSKHPVRIFLSDLLDAMDMQDFDRMALRHENEYGENIARICKESPLSANVEEIRRLLQLFCGSVLVICSEQDRWHDNARLKQMTTGLSHVTLGHPLPGKTHYPQVQEIVQVGQKITAWEASMPPRRQQNAA